MARRRERYEVRVGFLIFVALAALTFAIVFLGEQRGLFRPRYHLRTLMSRVNGLQEGAPVRLAGVDVGNVVRVEFSTDVDNPRIEVTLEVDVDVRKYIRRDSRAHIGTLGLLGDKFVGISMGSPTEPELEDWDYIESTDPLDVEKLIDEGVEVFDTLHKSADAFNELTLRAKEIARKIDTGEGTLGLIVNDPRMYFDIQRLLFLVESLTAEIESGKGTLAMMVRDPQLYANLNNLLRASTLLADSIRNGHGTIGQLLSERGLYARTDSLVSNLNALVERLTNGEGSLSKLGEDDSLYTNLVRALSSLDSLLVDVRANPKRYVNFSVF